MEPSFEPDIELYSPESFKTLLEHEVKRSRRYRDPLTILCLAFETQPADPQTQHSAEVFTINALNLRLRETDIPCKQENEYLVLMPSTSEHGGRMACERLESLFHVEHKTFDRVSFELSAFMGMATLPGDSSISSEELLRHASEALQHARVNRLTNAVIFSEIKH